jgi:stringent starvation protein B
MTSNRPYLIRAIYEWIGDNGLTPHLLVDAAQPGVQVPPQSVRDGQVVLNIAAQAVGQLDLGNDGVSFMARFSGVSRSVWVPLPAVLAIYAQETGQGMMLPIEAGDSEPGAPSPEPTPTAQPEGSKRPRLRVIK